ncbi:MAG TPA: hypothetical protein VKA34_16465 [Balneolales bacterium]|nr:hypothetical protein [Balneolales bacterium]
MGEWFIDISKWSNQFYDYSKNLICNYGVITYDNLSNEFKLADNESDIVSDLVFKPVDAHLHWLGIETGLEIFIKSVLIKYKVLPIKNRNILKKYPIINVFNSIKESEEYFNDDIAMVYRCCRWKVIAKNNVWISNQLKKEKIEYLYDIKTPTLGWLYNHGIDKLYELNLIDKKNLHFICRAIETFTDIRRNVDTHVFLGRTVGSIQNDRENVYIPLLNKLNELYLKQYE